MELIHTVLNPFLSPVMKWLKKQVTSELKKVAKWRFHPVGAASFPVAGLAYLMHLRSTNVGRWNRQSWENGEKIMFRYLHPGITDTDLGEVEKWGCSGDMQDRPNFGLTGDEHILWEKIKKLRPKRLMY